MHDDWQETLRLLEQVPLFARLSDADLNRAAGIIRKKVFQAGETIFDIGEGANAMFIVGEGAVDLTTTSQGDDEWLARLQQGEVFGEEALLYDDPRFYRATASKRSMIFRLTVENYQYAFSDFYEIEEALEVSIRSRRLSTQVELPWLQGGEYVHVMTRRHPAILGFKMITPLLFAMSGMVLSALLQWQWLPSRAYGWVGLVVTLCVTLLWFVWTTIDWRNDYFIVTNKRVVWVEKIALLYESRQEAPLRTIMSVGTAQSRIGSMLGYADVVVMTYVGTIRLRDLAHADAIASMIEAYWHKADITNQHEEAQAMAQKLHEKLNLPWQADQDSQTDIHREEEPQQEREAYQPGFLAWLLSDFIRLRFESDGAITYRKHWFVLIENIWLPVLLMTATLGALAARLGGMLAFIPMTFAVISLLVVMFVFFVWVVYQYADWRNDVFQVTLDQIIDIDRKPLGKVRRRAAPLENVLSIEYERLGFWGFLFNFGTVYISVGNNKLSFDHVYNPSEVQQDLFFRMGERLETVRQTQIEAERERVSEWIASYHRKIEQLHNEGNPGFVDDERLD